MIKTKKSKRQQRKKNLRDVKAVFTDILGMPPNEKTKKTIPLPGRVHGVFGSVTASFGVTENQDRGSLQMHLVS